MTQDVPSLLVERDGPLLLLTLNRPERLNALDRDLQGRLRDALLAGDADPAVRAIIITGAGRAFCSGADVAHLHAQTARSVDQQMVAFPPFTARQCKVYKPTICAVNGVCAGAGLHFVSDSDIVIASDGASFVDTHVNVGQVTALEPIGLMRRVSMTAVLRMVILGKAERLSARDALECQMVSEVVPAGALLERAKELGRIASHGSPAAMKTSLKAIWQSLEMGLSASYDVGYDMLIRHRTHPDAREGPAAFLEKRDPNWSE